MNIRPVRALAGVYGGLSLLAALTRFGAGGPQAAAAVAMALGGAALLAAALRPGRPPVLAAGGCALVLAAAVANGALSGAPNPVHWLVRLALSALIVCGLARAR